MLTVTYVVILGKQCLDEALYFLRKHAMSRINQYLNHSNYVSMYTRGSYPKYVFYNDSSMSKDILESF